MRHLFLEPGHPHLEELVEVVGPDGEELGAFQKRKVRPLRKGEDPTAEFEPGQLSIQEMIWIELFHFAGDEYQGTITNRLTAGHPETAK
jgi:hypothetical protein